LSGSENFCSIIVMSYEPSPTLTFGDFALRPPPMTVKCWLRA